MHLTWHFLVSQKRLFQLIGFILISSTNWPPTFRARIVHFPYGELKIWIFPSNWFVHAWHSLSSGSEIPTFFNFQHQADVELILFFRDFIFPTLL